MPNRGEVWLANLDPKRGTEPGKTRPVLIVQAQALLDAQHPSTLIIPLTTVLIDEAEPLRIRVHAAGRLPVLLTCSSINWVRSTIVDWYKALSSGSQTRMGFLSLQPCGLLASLLQYASLRISHALHKSCFFSRFTVSWVILS